MPGPVEIGTVRNSPRIGVRIKAGPGRWDMLARVVWQQAHGPIPAGHVIWHLNGNSADCRDDNLDCITVAERCRRQNEADPDRAHRGGLTGGALAVREGRLERARQTRSIYARRRRRDAARILAGLCPQCRAALRPILRHIVDRLGCRREYDALIGPAALQGRVAEATRDIEERP